MVRVNEMLERRRSNAYQPRRNGADRHCGVMMRNTGLPTLEGLSATPYAGKEKTEEEVKKAADIAWAKLQRNKEILREQKAAADAEWYRQEKQKQAMAIAQNKAAAERIKQASATASQGATAQPSGGDDFFSTVGKIITQTAGAIKESRGKDREEKRPVAVAVAPAPVTKPQPQKSPWLWVGGGLAALLAIGGIVIVATRKKR